MTKGKKKLGRPPEIYLIDSCFWGNALRLYFGYSIEEFYGDDWDDVPYESNCGNVYSEYVDCVLDALVPFNYNVTDIADDLYYANSHLCRNDFKNGKTTLFWLTDYTLGERGNVRFYMGDRKEDVYKKLKMVGCLLKYTVKGKK